MSDVNLKLDLGQHGLDKPGYVPRYTRALYFKSKKLFLGVPHQIHNRGCDVRVPLPFVVVVPVWYLLVAGLFLILAFSPKNRWFYSRFFPFFKNPAEAGFSCIFAGFEPVPFSGGGYTEKWTKF